MNKKLVQLPMFVFTSVVVVVVFLQSVAFGMGFHTDWTISRYMGSSKWSAILFALCNIGIALSVLKYLYNVKREHNLSWFWFLIVIVMILSFMLLSFCPVGLFDEQWGQFGVVSYIHRYSSYTLFVSMILITISTLVEIRRGLAINIFGLFAVVLACISVYCFLTGFDIFNGYVLFFEYAYIMVNLIFYLLIPKKSDIIRI